VEREPDEGGHGLQVAARIGRERRPQIAPSEPFDRRDDELRFCRSRALLADPSAPDRSQAVALGDSLHLAQDALC
jgi:hypothetical protein